MEKVSLQNHWEEVYKKQDSPEAVSWYQEHPQVVMEWIEELLPDRSSSIIDIGGGDSTLAHALLQKGYQHVSVLDISCNALQRARKNLGEEALKVNWICEDAAVFQPSKSYDLWHDRAAFHFLNSKKQKEGYKQALTAGVKPGGWVMLATFSKEGPRRCSGLDITQYSKKELQDFMGRAFKLEKAVFFDHTTPGGKVQNFLYTLFKRI
ncbi:class I SAM-dependent methyltransferase [Robertkochia flava]|uniref:class I SAM-dependent methyltransferase n=1 Tax=Robertkochia flava TaxID=3447986 RepID=UPI001CCD1482|nr:class I SAM-dependent methyltransferase [Robertkochia marina]